MMNCLIAAEVTLAHVNTLLLTQRQAVKRMPRGPISVY